MAFVSLGSDRVLSYSVCGDAATVVFIHGIMGSKKNLQGFIHRFCGEFPGEGVIAFDVRNHGESSKHWPPYTVAAAAHDVVRACEVLAIKPKALIGHSFGGKVCVFAARDLPDINQLWLLDCAPGTNVKTHVVSQRPSMNTLEIIEILDQLLWPLPSRKEVVSQLVERGVATNIALWMTTNLMTDGEHVRLIFDVPEIREMLLDFVRIDGWPHLGELASRMTIHIVAAQFGERLSVADEKLLAKNAHQKSFFHVLKNSGHFVHVDNPLGLIEIMRPFFGITRDLA